MRCVDSRFVTADDEDGYFFAAAQSRAQLSSSAELMSMINTIAPARPRTLNTLLILLIISLLSITDAMSSPSSSNKKPRLAPPATLKVHYGDMPFWRAECVRMALFIGDVPFEDCRHDKDASAALKASGKLTFGAVPVLEIDDGKILSQTQAMAVYAAKLAGIHPTDDSWASAKIDECINGCTDVTGTIGTTFRIADAEEKIKARQALIDKESNGRLWMHLSGLEKICALNNKSMGAGFSVGSTLSVADLAIWRLVGWVDSGTLDGIPKQFVADSFPALATLVMAVDAHPKVKEWRAKHSKFYDSK